MTVPSVSFEFFPPRSVEASFRLHSAVQELGPLGPDFVSVTYGAGGATRKLTQEAALAIHRSAHVPVAAHLTCVDATREETLAIATAYRDAGINRIVALRGDPPKGTGAFSAHPDGFANSVELVAALKANGAGHVTVGCYPDVHPDAASASADLDWLKRKADAGADAAITQFFFEAETFFRFRDAADKAGITLPILPGILPIENWTRTRRFAEACGAKIPALLDQAFVAAERDDRAGLLAVAQATELCSELVEGGVEHLHFYTLNTPSLTRDICLALGRTQSHTLHNVA